MQNGILTKTLQKFYPSPGLLSDVEISVWLQLAAWFMEYYVGMRARQENVIAFRNLLKFGLCIYVKLVEKLKYPQVENGSPTTLCMHNP
jgi:hypothetical protein